MMDARTRKYKSMNVLNTKDFTDLITEKIEELKNEVFEKYEQDSWHKLRGLVDFYETLENDAKWEDPYPIKNSGE